MPIMYLARSFYLRGPKFLGCYEGQPIVDVCASILGVPSAFLANEDGHQMCLARIDARLTAYVVVVIAMISAFSFYNIATVLRYMFVIRESYLRNLQEMVKVENKKKTYMASAEKAKMTKLKNTECFTFAVRALRAIGSGGTDRECMEKIREAAFEINPTVVPFFGVRNVHLICRPDSALLLTEGDVSSPRTLRSRIVKEPPTRPDERNVSE